MGAWSNKVTVTVESVLDVSSVTISADKTTVNVGESVNFTVSGTLTRAPNPTEIKLSEIDADIYINGSKHSTVKISDLPNGTSFYGSFSLEFQQAGSYTVDIYAYVTAKG